MHIYSEETPNPAVLKFLPGVPVSSAGRRVSRDMPDAPLVAQRIFHTLPQVSDLYFGADFIAVTKTEGDWLDLRADILEALADAGAAGQFPLTPLATAPVRPGASGADAEIAARIEAVLESHIRPAVAADGGNIMLESYAEGVAFVRMQGACAGCPSASITLRNGVETTLRHFVPEVSEVRAV